MDVQQWMTHVLTSTVTIINIRHWRNFHRPMPTCSCMCSELIFRCYCGLTWSNWRSSKYCQLWLEYRKLRHHTGRFNSACALQALLYVVSCSCITECKACSGTRCMCNSAGLSCTDYCKCEGGDIGCSPFISKQMDIEDDEGEPSVDDE